MLDSTLHHLKRLIPGPVFRFFQPIYHWKQAFLAACVYRFPSRKIKIIGITGTKGKSSTVEILNTILEKAGYKTALTNTIRFKIGDRSEENLYKMSMPGRFFMQRFLRRAVNEKCDYAILEMTSQGALLYRHLFINMDVFVFTNASPEHIEAHGSYENYIGSKVNLACELIKSSKKNRVLIVNGDDPESQKFLACQADTKISFSINDIRPYEVEESGLSFTLAGKRTASPLSGLFNLYNILAAITIAKSQGVGDEVISAAIQNFSEIPGRVEKINVGQPFDVIVDYAHTPDSLEKLYQAFPDKRKICVMGGTGGGRDTWKRPKMGEIADKYCETIILTDEDPYDEDPEKIIVEIASGIRSKKPEIIIDRREAMRKAFGLAKTGDVVLITGKGTDPYIMGPNGTKIPWSDAKIAKKELKRVGQNLFTPSA